MHDFRRPSKQEHLSELMELSGTLNDINLYSYLALAGESVALQREEMRAGRKRFFLEKLCVMSTGNLLHVRTYLNSIVEALLMNGYAVKKCVVETEGRGLIGVGEAFGKILFEVGLSFDPLLNVPYVPASSLKGAFRHILENKFGEELARYVFGNHTSFGLVGVTDAYPISARMNRLLEPDVLTPHYPETKHLKTELDVEPIPVVFAAIAPGVRFEFYIYYNKKLPCIFRKRNLRITQKLEGEYHIYDGDLAEALQNTSAKAIRLPMVDLAIIYALTQGVGAKTSIGYTRFRLIEYRTVR